MRKLVCDAFLSEYGEQLNNVLSEMNVGVLYAGSALKGDNLILELSDADMTEHPFITISSCVENGKVRASILGHPSLASLLCDGEAFSMEYEDLETHKFRTLNEAVHGLLSRAICHENIDFILKGKSFPLPEPRVPVHTEPPAEVLEILEKADAFYDRHEVTIYFADSMIDPALVVETPDNTYTFRQCQDDREQTFWLGLSVYSASAFCEEDGAWYFRGVETSDKLKDAIESVTGCSFKDAPASGPDASA